MIVPLVGYGRWLVTSTARGTPVRHGLMTSKFSIAAIAVALALALTGRIADELEYDVLRMTPPDKWSRAS